MSSIHGIAYSVHGVETLCPLHMALHTLQQGYFPEVLALAGCGYFPEVLALPRRGYFPEVLALPRRGYFSISKFVCFTLLM